MIIDTHAHYDDEAFDSDREDLLGQMEKQGIGHIVNVCASIGQFHRTVELTEKYPFIYGAVGVHPDDADKPLAKSAWITIGTRKRKNTGNSRKCFVPSWILPDRKSFRL